MYASLLPAAVFGIRLGGMSGETKLHVHLLSSPAAGHLAFLQELLAPAVILSSGETIPPQTEILVGGRITAVALDSLPHLRAFIVPWAGLPQNLADLLPDYPQLTVHNLHHNATPVAETALALLLAAAKQIQPLDQALRRGDWTVRDERWDQSMLLAGKTALILGYGAIGQKLAHYGRALGMRVLATRRRAETDFDGVAHLYPPEQLADLLPQSQLLLVCLPLTPATEGIIGAAELALLPDGAIVVNIGRGPVIDEAALYGELRSGRLRAGLDVWYNYPADAEARANTIPASYPFHELENVVMSPHRAGGSDQTERLRLRALADLLNAAAAGLPIPNQVDLGRGY
jgi:phosphoglycerate dehydrogenase-like enzyme